MVRLILALCLASPAAAACLGPPLPKGALWDDGARTEVLRQAADAVTLREVSVAGDVRLETLRDGVFPLVISEAGLSQTIAWPQDLPDLASLPQGASDFAGEMTVEGSYSAPVALHLEVLAPDSLTVQGCSYAVIVLRLTPKGFGQAGTLWYAPALRLTLAEGQRHVTALR